MKKRILLLLCTMILTLVMTGCGLDPKLSKFKNDLDGFCTEVATIDTTINNIDATSETAKDELLGELDKLDELFKVLAEMDVPTEYSYMVELADEASEYMTTAVAAYHDAFSNNSYNEYTADYAKQNYERAYRRISVIIKLLHGETLDDADIIIQQGNDTEAAE